MAPLRRLLLVADTGPGKGWGHLSRMVAVGQAWRRTHGEAVLAAAEIPEWVQRHCQGAGIQWQEIEALRNPVPPSTELITHFTAFKPDAICLDGYRFDDSFATAAKSCCRFLVAFDDFGHATHEFADLIVNANVYAAADSYPQLRGKLLCGSRYVVLREEFHQVARSDCLSARLSQLATHEVGPLRILVSLGGAATPGNWRTILQGLAQANLPVGSRIDLLLGGGPSNHKNESANKVLDLADLRTQSNFADRGITLFGQDSSQNIPHLFRRANLAVAASGSSLNELAFLGVPTVAFATADNQVAVGQGYDRHGAAWFLSSRLEDGKTNHAEFDPKFAGLSETNSPKLNSTFVEELACRVRSLASAPALRHEMAQRAMELIDGLGANRIAERIRVGQLKLRSVNSGDWRMLLELRNEERVRLNSFSPEPVPETSHRNWLEKKLADPCAKIWAIEGDNCKFLGQSRLDWHDDQRQATVGIAVCAEARGIGVAESALHLLESEAKQLGLEHLEAIIKPENVASLNLFSRAGYKNAELRLGLPPECSRMVLCLNQNERRY